MGQSAAGFRVGRIFNRRSVCHSPEIEANTFKILESDFSEEFLDPEVKMKSS